LSRYRTPAILWTLGRYFAEFSMCGLLNQSENLYGLIQGLILQDGSAVPELRPVPLGKSAEFSEE